jgi:hypothetical protein
MTLGDDFHPRKVNISNPITLEAFADFLRRLELPDNDPEKLVREVGIKLEQK